MKDKGHQLWVKVTGYSFCKKNKNIPSSLNLLVKTQQSGNKSVIILFSKTRDKGKHH